MARSLPFDITPDGGVPCVLLDGPYAGTMGEVTLNPGTDTPPPTLKYLDGDRLVYVLRGRRRIRHGDTHGQTVESRGVGYVVDPRCPFMVDAKRAQDEARVEAEVQR